MSFPFLKDKKTLASRMENHVHHEEKSRVKELSLGEMKLRDLAQTGLTNQVLFERPDDEGYSHGYTSNFIKIKVKTDLDLRNRILPVKLQLLAGDILVGDLVHKNDIEKV